MISLLFAGYYKRKLTETIPAGVYLFMLLSYLLGITGHISHITGLFALYEVMGLVGTAYLALIKKEDIKSPFRDPGNLIFIVILIILWFLSLHMRVTNFDDFHSWAITPKDIYYVDGLPTGGMASTFYRDYFPLVYFMDYFVLKLVGDYRESALFFVLWGLMLVSLAEMLHLRDDDDTLRYVCRIEAGLILPFLFSFQFLHCLGLDILATTVFGSVLVYIFSSKTKDDTFDLIRITLAATVLGMLKTTSLIFTAVCIAVYFVKNTDLKKPALWLRSAVLPVIAGSFWASWKIFCKIKGNTTYLSDNLDRNLSGGGVRLPDYAAGTIKDFIFRLFTYGLNDGAIGLTSAMIFLIFVVSFIIYMRVGGRDIRDILAFVLVILGMAGYLVVMMYVYLFVFEEWEALTLSSYDRYIASYFGAMLYLALYQLLAVRLKVSWAMPAFILILAATINFPYVAKTLIPSGYEREYGGTIAEIDAIGEEFMSAAGELPGYGESILVVDYSLDQLRAKVIPYAAVPGVTRVMKPSDDGEMPTEQEIEDEAADHGARVIRLTPDE